MAEKDFDSAPPPAYTPIPPDPPHSPNAQAASSAQGLDDHFRGLNITAPASYPAGSPTTSAGASRTTRSSSGLGTVSNAPRYLYYQIFSPDGVVESKCAFSEGDPNTGRVVASHISPPRTVQSIKRFLCKQEKISDIQNVDLLASALTSESELSDQDRPQILSPDGPGSDSDDPMALVIKDLPPTASSETQRSPVPDSGHSLRLPGPFSLTPLQLRHANLVGSVVFSPDGSRIASGSYDKTISIWDVTTGRLLAGPIQTHSDVQSVVFSPDGRHIVSGFYKPPFIQMWDAQTGTPVSLQFEGHGEGVSSIAFSPDGRCIASGSYDKTIRIWDAKLGRDLVGPMKGHTDYVMSVAFSPDGFQVASGSCDATVRVWNTKTGQLVAGPYQGHSSTVYSVAFSPNGRWVVSSSYDHDVRVWDAENGAQAGSASSQCFKGHSNAVTSVAFGPSGQWIASGSYDRTVRVWSFETGQEGSTLGIIQVPENQLITSIAISPKGDRIVAGTESGSVYVWKSE